MDAISILAYFLIYSFIGWLIDSAYRSWDAKKWMSRSFFPVPLCPVYGFGALLVLFLHSLISDAPLVVQGMILGIFLSALEYIGGWLVWVLFHRRLWTYGEKRAPLGGFTDLWHAVVWGILGVAVLAIVQPWLESVLYFLP